jgi:hypothetical protein
MKFKIGDMVKVVNYRSVFWHCKDGKTFEMDSCPDLIGKVGIVVKATETQNINQYAIEGIPEKYAWYNEEQLEMVNHNPNSIEVCVFMNSNKK